MGHKKMENEKTELKELIEYMANILTKQTDTLQKQNDIFNVVIETLSKVSQSMVEADKFRTEKSSLWEKSRTTDTRLNNLEILIKGDGLDKNGIYQNTKNNTTDIEDIYKKLNELKQKNIAFESYLGATNNKVGILENKQDIAINQQNTLDNNYKEIKQTLSEYSIRIDSSSKLIKILTATMMGIITFILSIKNLFR